MTLAQFIKQHRAEIDEITQSPIHNDEERELWIWNDEGLYQWARESGVHI